MQIGNMGSWSNLHISSYSKGRKTLGLCSFVANFSQAILRLLVRCLVSVLTWSFNFNKNVHMYAHELKCSKGNRHFYCMSEDSAIEESVVMFWLDDAPLKPREIDSFILSLKSWCEAQSFNFRIYLDNECLHRRIE